MSSKKAPLSKYTPTCLQLGIESVTCMNCIARDFRSRLTSKPKCRPTWRLRGARGDTVTAEGFLHCTSTPYAHGTMQVHSGLLLLPSGVPYTPASRLLTRASAGQSAPWPHSPGSVISSIWIFSNDSPLVLNTRYSTESSGRDLPSGVTASVASFESGKTVSCAR